MTTKKSKAERAAKLADLIEWGELVLTEGRPRLKHIDAEMLFGEHALLIVEALRRQAEEEVDE